MNINARLRNLQAELKAPKSQYNNFGKYKYRNAEDILEALKPLAVKHSLTFVIYDEIELLGDRFYVKAVVICRNDEGEELASTAYAREEESKKGMDGSQVTGAASSYARKYALNGMLLIDDTKDSDATNAGGDTPSTGGGFPTGKTKTDSKDEKDYMGEAINYIKGASNKQHAYELVMQKHGDKFSDKQKEGIKKFVR